MTDPDVFAALGPVAAALEAQGVAHYVGGSLASSTHGMPRSTLDVDFVAEMFKVDIFVNKGRRFDTSALARAAYHSLDPDPAAPRVRVASPEDAILAKLDWYRAGGESSERQWSDVLGILKAKGAALDRAYLEEHADGLGVRDLLDRALREAT